MCGRVTLVGLSLQARCPIKNKNKVLHQLTLGLSHVSVNHSHKVRVIVNSATQILMHRLQNTYWLLLLLFNVHVPPDFVTELSVCYRVV